MKKGILPTSEDTSALTASDYDSSSIKILIKSNIFIFLFCNHYTNGNVIRN